MKIKVTLIIYSLAKGGAERIFSTIANNLDSTKFDVTVVTFHTVKNSYTINNSQVRMISFNEQRSLRAIPKLFKFLLLYDSDYILTTIAQVNVLVGLMIPLIKWLRFGKKTKYFLRESAIPSINNQYSKYPAWLLKLMIQFSYRNFDKIIAQGENMKSDLEHEMGLKKIDIQVINNPVQVFNVSANKNKINNQVSFITVGNLRKEKGYERLLKAISYLGDLNFIYKIIGDGPEMNHVKQMANQLGLSSKILFLGSSNQVGEELVKADLFLQGSFYEGFPNALIEANSLGLPVIAFDVPGGTSEIIRNYQNGILVEVGNIELYAEAIKEALSYTFDSNQIILDTKKRFGIATIMKQYEGLFHY